MAGKRALRGIQPGGSIPRTLFRRQVARIGELFSQLPAVRQLAFWDLVGDSEADWRTDDSSGRPTERARKPKDQIT